jgi:hypothetical protein
MWLNDTVWSFGMSNSFATEMLDLAALAGPELHEGVDEVSAFVRSRMLPTGAFRGRGEAGDIYYTVFGMDCMLALGATLDPAQLIAYLSSFGGGSRLDLMHLGCLARCWSRMGLEGLPVHDAERILAGVESYRSKDGGYHIEPGAEHGSIYGCFMAYAAYQDMGVEVPDVNGIADSIDALRMADGLYASERALQKATTNAAVGALLMLERLGRPVSGHVAEWLMDQCHAKGGFVAAPGVPIPDLVSTATALFALRKSGVDLTSVQARCVTFLGSVWDDTGGFAGNWMDEIADCEYTFYALLSLGCLAATA